MERIGKHKCETQTDREMEGETEVERKMERGEERERGNGADRRKLQCDFVPCENVSEWKELEATSVVPSTRKTSELVTHLLLPSSCFSHLKFLLSVVSLIVVSHVYLPLSRS